jgi:hypothetical protein
VSAPHATTAAARKRRAGAMRRYDGVCMLLTE